MTYRTLSSAWKKLWPDSVAEGDFEGFEPDDSAHIHEFLWENFGRSAALKLEGEDVHELLKSHKIE